MHRNAKKLSLPIRTSRLVIRRLEASDRHEYLSLYHDPLVTFHSGSLIGLEPEVKWRCIMAAKAAFNQPLAIVRLDTCQLAGICGFLDRADLGKECFEIWLVLRESCTGYGLGTEVARKLTEVSFLVFNARRVLGAVASGNVRGLNVFQKLGYAYLGGAKDAGATPWLINGLVKDSMYGIDRSALGRFLPAREVSETLNTSRADPGARLPGSAAKTAEV